MKDGYDPEMQRYWGTYAVRLTADSGQIYESNVMPNPTLVEVNQVAGDFTNKIRRNQALEARHKRGWDKYNITIEIALDKNGRETEVLHLRRTTPHRRPF